MAARSGHTDLPHDLAQFVVESELGLGHGFWNLVANGATFRSLERRPTRPGRQLIAAYRAELNQVEWTVNAQVQAWRDGLPTPVGPELEAMLARWRALRPGEELAAGSRPASPRSALRPSAGQSPRAARTRSRSSSSPMAAASSGRSRMVPLPDLSSGWWAVKPASRPCCQP
jgi:hypothetical protein